ncbi:MAG: radical SAM family heme chaperone HemW [Mariprofundaceae bacterium]|nr:radical SAM family heme chaperone HemW [Mariprofundaceae bacterium]
MVVKVFNQTVVMFGLYVHIPFCLHKCHYCDFNSHVQADIDWPAYQAALLTELKQWSTQTQFQHKQLKTIFFGGGTPSLAPPALIQAVVDAAYQHFDCAESVEVSLEANPGTVDMDHFTGYRQAGVNRLSIGVQSFDEQELKWLQRIHSVDEVHRAFKIARDVGFDNINLDLMYALPKQNIAHWLNHLEQAIALKPEHISAYQLTVEPHTLLAATHAKKPLPIADEDESLDFFWKTRALLQENNYQAYEISNFSKPTLKCQHNDAYWLYRDYIGIGAGANGKWDQLDGGVTRYRNHNQPQAYMTHIQDNKQAISFQESLDSNTAASESLWLALRRSEGVSLTWFEQRFQQKCHAMFGSVFKPWLQTGQLCEKNNRLFLAEHALVMVDELASQILDYDG